MRFRLLTGLALGVLLGTSSGCGSGSKVASVSGKITVNGQPLANAFVSFQPIAPDGTAVAPAPGSSGKTDANGVYTLKMTTGQSGAWVGSHKVRIELRQTQPGEGGETRPPRGGWGNVNIIPPKYNAETILTCDVPSGGTDAANFDLEVPNP